MAINPVPPVVALMAVVIIIKSLNSHAGHSWFCTCRQRSNTSQQFHFQNLSRYYKPVRNAASRKDVTQCPITFKFDPTHNAFVIEIAEGSHWGSVSAMHSTIEMCITCEVLRAPWHWGSVAVGHPGPIGPERPGIFLSFGRLYNDASTMVSAKLTTSDKARQFYHVVVSAVQDADIYFSLCTTPIWLRALYALAGLVHAAELQEYMIRCVLWIQLRTIFFKNDFWESHGRCTVLRYFYFWPPPWVSRFEAWSQVVRSKVILWLNYNLGSHLLGMSPWYQEYELKASHTNSKKTSAVRT